MKCFASLCFALTSVGPPLQSYLFFLYFFLLKTKRLNVTYLGFSIHWSVCSLSGDFKPPSLLFRVWWKGIQAPKWSSQSRSLTRPLVNGPMLITSISEDHYSFDLLRGGKSYTFLNKAVSYEGGGRKFKSVKVEWKWKTCNTVGGEKKCYKPNTVRAKKKKKTTKNHMVEPLQTSEFM